jgi:peptidoglycan/LPS O-acetylase OafA/YrhL
VLERVATTIALSPLRLLFSGHAAVGLFFVLSGFVLARYLQSEPNITYLQYLVRRIFRIWVPFAAVILIAALLRSSINPSPIPGHDWINLSWNEPVTWHLLAGHLLMIGGSPYDNLNNPMWSLTHELRISVVFPLLLAFVSKRPRTAVAISLSVFVGFSISRFIQFLFSHVGSNVLRVMGMSLIDTARYSFLFVLGILVAINWQKLPALRQKIRLPEWTAWTLVFLMLMLPYNAAYMDFILGVGATLLLVLCITSKRAQSFLRKPPLQYLGRISYSLYLVHMVVMLACFYLLPRDVPVLLVPVVVVPVAFIAAIFVNKTIELPCNSVGKLLAEKCKPRGDTL